MKANITVVATKTLTAGLVPSEDVAMRRNDQIIGVKSNLEDSTGCGRTVLHLLILRLGVLEFSWGIE